jgi:hypothetical protein
VVPTFWKKITASAFRTEGGGSMVLESIDTSYQTRQPQPRRLHLNFQVNECKAFDRDGIILK